MALGTACTNYDQNPSWWNSFWCNLQMNIPGKSSGDYNTNPDAFPKADLAPVAPQTYDQMVNFGSWTSQQAVDLTSQNLASALKAAMNTLPSTNPPKDVVSGPSSYTWWIVGGVVIGVMLFGGKRFL